MPQREKKTKIENKQNGKEIDANRPMIKTKRRRNRKSPSNQNVFVLYFSLINNADVEKNMPSSSSKHHLVGTQHFGS